MVKLYFKGECSKFVNLNVETGEPEGDDGQSPRKNANANAGAFGFEPLPDLPPQEEDFTPPTDDFEKPISVDEEIF